MQQRYCKGTGVVPSMRLRSSPDTRPFLRLADQEVKYAFDHTTVQLDDDRICKFECHKFEGEERRKFCPPHHNVAAVSPLPGINTREYRRHKAYHMAYLRMPMMKLRMAARHRKVKATGTRHALVNRLGRAEILITKKAEAHERAYVLFEVDNPEVRLG